MLWLGKTSNLFKGFLNTNNIRSRCLKISRQRRIPELGIRAHLNVPESSLESVDLTNGMRLICECKDSCITTVGFVVPAGSMHERTEERGASLFMEHLIFRRTKCRTREEIAEILDRTGARLGALAMRDIFLFYGTVPSYDIETIVELLADVVINGITCNEDIIAERLLILRELFEMETDNERVVMDYLPTMAYQKTELGRSVYPETCAVKNLQVEAIEGFRKRLFQPESMTMITTGGTSFAEIQRLTSEYFTGSELRLRDDDESLGHVAVAVEGPGHANCQDHCTLTVAKEIIGSWDLTYGGSMNNSPYLAQCAFNTDMCHIYKSFNIGWANTSLWGCYFSCEKMKLEDMLWMVQNEWMRLCSTITSKEVDRAVNQCKTREIARINDSVDRFFDIGNCLYRQGCYVSLNNRIARYDRVTADELREVANKYIYDQCPVVAAVGAVDNLPDYNRIRSYMYRIRH